MDCMRDDAQVFQFYVGDQGAYLTCESKNWIVRRMATAKLLLRGIVGDLVVDATDKGLGPALARLRADGNRLNVNLLGEAVLGEAEAARRLEEVSRLVSRDDVDYVSVKVSAVTGPHNPWGFEEVVAHGVEALSPLYRLARDHGTFLNLDMEDYKDLDLTIEVFTAI